MSVSTDKDHEAIFEYLDSHGVVNKDRGKQDLKQTPRQHYIKRNHEVYRSIDLHGKREHEAVAVLKQAIFECRNKGVLKMLIIHGVGLHSNPQEGPVLKKTILLMLEHELSGFIRDFRPAAPRDGGDGATWVRLK